MGFFFNRKKKDSEGLPPFLSALEDGESLLIVRLKGAVGSSILPEALKIRKKVQSSPGYHDKNTLYDFKEVDSIDSAVVAQLITVFSELKKSHHRMGVINLKDSFRSELQILRVDKYIVEYSSEAEAIRELTSGGA